MAEGERGARRPRRGPGATPGVLDRLEVGREGRVDRVHLDAEEQRQRVRGDVVRPPRGAALVLAQVRVALPLEERLREAARRLLHPHDERARLVARARRLERAPGPAATSTSPRRSTSTSRATAEGSRCPAGTTNANGLAARAGPAVHRERRAQPVLAVRRGVLEDGERGLELRLDDVARAATCPPGQGAGKLRRGGARVVAGAAPLELLRLHLDRRREARGGRLGEEAHPAVRVRVGAARRPGVEDRAGDDAGPPRGGEARGDVRPERARGGDERAVHVRLPRVGVGRHEEARPPRAHLVHVVHDLRVPAVVQVPDA